MYVFIYKQVTNWILHKLYSISFYFDQLNYIQYKTQNQKFFFWKLTLKKTLAIQMANVQIDIICYRQ